MRLLLVLGTLALVVSGCSVQAPPTAPTPTLIPMADMMGMYPQQTVFVGTADHLSAITLLNHYIRYEISTSGSAQVVAERAGSWVYILDAASAQRRRVRALSAASGAEHAVQSITDVAEGVHVMSIESDGRLLILKQDAQHAWIDAYRGGDLQPLGVIAEKPGCADQLVSNSSRFATVCRATGEIAFDDLRGNHTSVDGAPRNIVAAAMASDGTLYVATAEPRLATVAPGTTNPLDLTWPTAWTGRVLSDSLSIAEDGGSVVIGQQADDGVWLRVFAKGDPAHGKSVWLTGQPIGAGVIALWPFAYFSVDRTIRHVELTSGQLEIMAEVGPDAVPLAVVNG